MEQLLISPYLLAVLFFGVATLYSSSGLGGGTSYTALLAVFGASHRAIPPVSLSMNVVVSLMAAINYLREGHGRIRLIAPLVVSSVPMAYLGGWLDVEASVFYPVLVVVLVAVAARIFLWPRVELDVRWPRSAKLATVLMLGATIGFLSGMLGIGGGIFLVPALMIFGLAPLKEATTAGAVYILVNSVAGLGGHLRRFTPEFADIAPLVGAVALGGFVGSRLTTVHLQQTTVRKIMGVIVVVAAGLLTIRML